MEQSKMKKFKEVNFIGTVQKNNTILLFFLLITALVLFPDNAFASGGIDEFTRPLQKFVDLLSGTWAKAIATISFVIAGAALALFKKAIDEQMQTVLYIIMGLCVVLAGGPMVINFFGFSGALIA
ncbi:MAG TPA: hypothetical protein DEB43_06955 [Desulfovibrio sp.]|nr:hypothetical protein [Desulfovibrio sp.]